MEYNFISQFGQGFLILLTHYKERVKVYFCLWKRLYPNYNTPCSHPLSCFKRKDNSWPGVTYFNLEGRASSVDLFIFLLASGFPPSLVIAFGKDA